jgi:hypothetical protein
MASEWIKQLLPLDRPEYAKQPEALLTDLLWRSKGSNISQIIQLSREKELYKLVPKRYDKNRSKIIIETFPVAEKVNIQDLFIIPDNIADPIKPLLNSLLAPKSRGDKAAAVVPANPNAIVFQTLHGLVNKPGPADLAKIIEIVGWLGGSQGEGHVAKIFIEACNNSNSVDQGFTGLLDAIVSLIARKTWADLAAGKKGYDIEWPKVAPGLIDPSRGKSLIADNYMYTPFRWFWEKWEVLCNPENKWIEILPTRRFVDWATCLLRTGLSFAYLWEANLFVLLQDVIRKEMEYRKTGSSSTIGRETLNSMCMNGAKLASIEPVLTPPSQKDIWPALRSLLARGYEVRESILGLDQIFNINPGENLISLVNRWLNTLTMEDLEILSKPSKVESETAENAREFVRYLLRPRSSDDDTADQSDFYFLARSNKANNFWFQPGPEWFIVTTSLLARKPGGASTLGLLLDDLQKLGIRVERSVLIEILEEVGLSTDSPDADNALVITSGF